MPNGKIMPGPCQFFFIKNISKPSENNEGESLYSRFKDEDL